MGILNSELNYDLVLKDLTDCCLKCGECQKEECLVGYAQKSITTCFREGVTYVENGSEKIPVTDFKMYNEEEFEKGIAHILRQCRSCKENHFENCIINIIRSCYEVGLFGEVQAYEGSNFRYLNQINMKFPEKAVRVIDEFHNTEES